MAQAHTLLSVSAGLEGLPLGCKAQLPRLHRLPEHLLAATLQSAHLHWPGQRQGTGQTWQQ